MSILTHLHVFLPTTSSLRRAVAEGGTVEHQLGKEFFKKYGLPLHHLLYPNNLPIAHRLHKIHTLGIAGKVDLHGI